MTAPLTAEGYNAEVRRAADLLAVALRDVKIKDTPAHRAAVDAARDALDDVFGLRGTVVPNPMDYHDAHK